MTPQPLVIIGGGEHAQVVADAVRSQPARWELVGFTDPSSAAGGGVLGLDHLGDDASLRDRLRTTNEDDRPALVLGFGTTADARRRAVASFGEEVRWATVVHAAAWVSPSAIVGPGAVILAGAVVNAGARIGAHAIVNSGVVVEHGVVIGSGAHLAPGTVVGGGTAIGDDTVIGLAAAVRDHLTIGRAAVVGMGAVVVADVPDGATVLGNPARVQVVPRA